MRLLMLILTGAAAATATCLDAAESEIRQRSFFVQLTTIIDGVEMSPFLGLPLTANSPDVYYTDEPTLQLHILEGNEGRGGTYLTPPEQLQLFAITDLQPDHFIVTVRWQSTPTLTNTRIDLPPTMADWSHPLTVGSAVVEDDVLVVLDALGPWHWDRRIIFDADIRGKRYQARLEGYGFYPRVTLPGDYNSSGIVEQGDLDMVLLNWGTLADRRSPQGDLYWLHDRPDGIVSQAELDRVLLNWGRVLSAPVPPDGVAIPEPSTLTLAVAGLALCCVLRRP